MATLVLGVVGGAIGGPIGAAVGSAIGGAIDRRVFAGKRREGPRLQELRVQASSYGQPIPRLFGTMRVAGTVFWATDLQERRTRTGGGKGAPKATEYSYSASFAVLLSARPILAVGRVWADGKLLRGAAGDWKARTGFRVHLGSEDQAADPLIASAEARAPAARGCAYAVFEGLELQDFGNRLPNLTFEVVADPGPVGVGAIACELAGEIDAEVAAELDGFAATGGSVRAVLDALAQAGCAQAAARGPRMILRDAPGGAVEVADAGVSSDGSAAGRASRRRRLAPADTVPRVVTVAHYDPARDGQAGLQRAARPGSGGRVEAVELPAAVSAGAAKSLAARLLGRAEAGRTRRTVSLGPEGLAIGPGDAVRIAGEAGTWRVVAAECERWRSELELAPAEPGALPVPASGGRLLPAPDLVAGATVLHAFELPGEALAGPRLLVAASGGAGWRGAALLHRIDGGGAWTEAGGTAAPAVMGVVEIPPLPASAALADLRSAVVVRLAAHMALEEADDAALDAGANAALLGDEVVQFGRATPLGGGRWRIERLLRGRRGTEDAAPAAAGARFVLLEADALRPIDLPPEAIGGRVRVMASGVGDADGPVETEAAADGRSVLPLAPAHLRVEEAPGGGATVRWLRRSRAGWAWVDGTDAPLGEETEAYRCVVARADGSERVVETATPELEVAAAERPATVRVAQRGRWGLGRAATIAVPG